MARQGRIWRTDARGLLLNDAHRDHLRPPFQAPLEAVIAACTTHIEADLHSLYVTGSVARGLARPGLSDLNVFGVLEAATDPELVMQDWMLLAEEQIVRTHPAISDVQLELWPQGFIFRDPDEFSIGAFIIVTHAVCVWGSDLTPELPDYTLRDRRTRLAIANDDIVQLLPDIDEAWAELENDPSGENARYWCRRIGKHLVHAGFGLVMEAAGTHTRDLDVSAAAFSQHYPEQAAAIAQAVAWVDAPVDRLEPLLDYLDDFGEWLLDRCEAWLDTHNPQRLECFPTGADDEEA